VRKITLLLISFLSLLMTQTLSANQKNQDPETIVFSFQKQKNPADLKTSADAVAAYLSTEIGKKVEVLVPTTYSSTVQAFISNKLHVGYMDSLPYILAKKESEIEIIAVEKRNGKTDYESLIVVKKESPIKSLTDLKGKKMAFTSQTSTSGYLMPYSRLLSDKVLSKPDDLKTFFTDSLYAGGYDKALQAVVQGQTDAAAFSDYVVEGKKADLYGSQTQRDQIRVLARTSGVPTHLVAVSSKLSKELKQKIQTALLKMSKDKPELLSSVYGAAELIVPTKPEDHVKRTRQALADTGLDVKTFVK
jgi:phosphonate transport system substrate-binding protein